MDLYLLSFLSIIIVLCVNFLRKSRYEFSGSQIVLISLLEIFFGVLGTMLLYYIENGEWGGTSFFGAVLFLPLSFVPVSIFVTFSYQRCMDYIAPSGLAMFIINKLNCYIAGCCEGKNIGFSFDGKPIYFPSQITEMVSTAFIILLLLILEKRRNYQGIIYPLGMVIYGIVRFILNIFREEWITTNMFMPFGNIWALVTIILGGSWLVFNHTKKKKKILK